MFQEYISYKADRVQAKLGLGTEKDFLTAHNHMKEDLGTPFLLTSLGSRISKGFNQASSGFMQSEEERMFA